jgi:hypothetical protein
MRFNGLPDAERQATIAALDRSGHGATLDEPDQRRLATLNPIFRDPLLLQGMRVDVDRQRSLIQLHIPWR